MNQELIETAARAVADDNPVWHLRDDRPALWGEVKESAKDRYRQQARAVIAAIHPTVSSVEELDALEPGSAVLCTGERAGEDDGDQVFILTSATVGPWRNDRMEYAPEVLLDNYEMVTLLHAGGAA